MKFLVKILAVFITMFSIFGTVVPNTSGKKTDYQECKNVILMIGDGMGFNSIKMAEKNYGKDTSAFYQFPLNGESKTASAGGPYTDSGAGGSALATGVRIAFKTIGVYPWDLDAKKSHPMNLTELAISQGKSAGVVTTDTLVGATPSDFSAHVGFRENFSEIARQQVNSKLTLLWGNETHYISDLKDVANNNGFSFVRNFNDIWKCNLNNRSIGLFKLKKDNVPPELSPTVDQMTKAAIDILDDDKDGFFLMVEESGIDESSDDKNGSGMADAIENFNKAIQYALNYAKEHGDTMVVVTADHETGGIKKIGGKYVYTTSLHTNANVPLKVYGCSNFIKNGEKIENREVGRRIACVMGEKSFPIEVKK